mmetsp:Transcript_9890/g.22719  ORF Transcript_9890/g.22719 Transcript_9890/m.22719 type:complete len:418 (+) Transcript_9890:144-1397(+)
MINAMKLLHSRQRGGLGHLHTSRAHTLAEKQGLELDNRDDVGARADNQSRAQRNHGASPNGEEVLVVRILGVLEHAQVLLVTDTVGGTSRHGLVVVLGALGRGSGVGCAGWGVGLVRRDGAVRANTLRADALVLKGSTALVGTHAELLATGNSGRRWVVDRARGLAHVDLDIVDNLASGLDNNRGKRGADSPDASAVREHGVVVCHNLGHRLERAVKLQGDVLCRRRAPVRGGESELVGTALVSSEVEQGGAANKDHTVGRVVDLGEVGRTAWCAPQPPTVGEAGVADADGHRRRGRDDDGGKAVSARLFNDVPGKEGGLAVVGPSSVEDGQSVERDRVEGVAGSTTGEVDRVDSSSDRKGSQSGFGAVLALNASAEHLKALGAHRGGTAVRDNKTNRVETADLGAEGGDGTLGIHE